jgi:4,5-DOPA dioxygenase extradiol
MMLVEDSSARRFLAGLGAELGKPKAILVASAHWETDRLAVSIAERPETIHDFCGFPPALYESRYAAPGAPDAARRAAELVEGAGMTAVLDAGRGLDHGAWVPLQLMYPEADVPVAQISIESHLGPRRQLEVGRALAPLRDDGVMIMGSGNLSHDLSGMQRGAVDAPAPGWVADFADWVCDAVAADRLDDLADYRRAAPHGERNHPTEDHFLPLFTAIGAGGPGARGERLHASYSYAVLAMDAYAFD